MDVQKIRLLRAKLRLLERESGDPFKSDSGCCGLTLAQCHTLIEVGSTGEVSLVDLAANLGLDTSTLSRTINGLVFLGLVNRLTNEKDRRYVSISLTDQGKKVFIEIEKTFNDYFLRVMEIVPLEKREAIIEGISLFADALHTYNHSAACCRDEAPSAPGESE